jgi:hypothetical protein
MTMAADWCGGRVPRADPGGATWRYAQTTGWRRSARVHLWEGERERGSELGRASHDPHVPRHPVLGGLGGPLHPARPGGRSTKERDWR